MTTSETALAPLEGVRPDTGEIVAVPSGERASIAERFRGASLQAVSDDQAATLTAPRALEELDILPTGEVYLSQVGYRRTLNAVFRPGGWSLVPLEKPAMVGATLIQPWALYVNGAFISSTYGEADYQRNNARSSYATAAESLKSNALMRCCKDLGIASECWDRRFTERFKAEHCINVGGKWKRKTTTGASDAKVAPLTDTDIAF